MKRFTHILFVAFLFFFHGCIERESPAEKIRNNFPEQLKLSAKNETNLWRKDEVVFLDYDRLLQRAPDFNSNAFLLLCGRAELPKQANDVDGDGSIDHIIFLTDFLPHETKSIQWYYAKSGEIIRSYPKRTQAELSIKMGGKFIDRKYQGGAFQKVDFLRVPPEHTDHSEFIRYEGPGWESDQIGYRFYLDWRNAIDIFGKKELALVLHDVGCDGFESYHHMANWGMDILKVGESLGIGTVAIWDGNKANRVSQVDSTTCQIILNGSLQSLIRTNYFGWKAQGKVFDLTSELSILAGSRLTCHSLQISGTPENLCTGVVQLPETEVLTSVEENKGWSYFATYGKQSLAGDTLGMAIIYRSENLIALSKDQFSHVIVLKPEAGKLTYYFLAVWQQEAGAPKNKKEFIAYLEETKEKLNSPIQVMFE